MTDLNPPKWASPPPTQTYSTSNTTWEPSTNPDYIWREDSSGQWHRVPRPSSPKTPDDVPVYQTSRYPCTSLPFDHPSQWQISAVPCDKDAVVHAMIRRLLADFGDPWRVTWTPMAYQPHGGSFTAARPCNLCLRGIGTARNNQMFMVTTDMFTPRYPPINERDPLVYHTNTFLSTASVRWIEHRRRHFNGVASHLTYPDNLLIQTVLVSRHRRLIALVTELEFAVRARIPVYARLSAVQFPESE